MAKPLKVKRSHSSYRKKSNKKSIIVIIVALVLAGAVSAYIFRDNIYTNKHTN